MPTTHALPTRPFGSTDMRIMRVGFGAWAIDDGGSYNAWGGQDDAESVAAIQRAIASGINWIDAAAVYGQGHSEEIVRAALRAWSLPNRLSARQHERSR